MEDLLNENLLEDYGDLSFFVDPQWRRENDYNCKGMGLDVFFPQDSEGVERAQAICATCPVRKVCLEYALALPEDYGIWGGVSERQRKLIRQRRKVARAAANKKKKK
jgi:WhiB family redox-sensing transcriptional regulator